MKKTIRMLFTIIMISSFIVGCSKKETDSGQTASTEASSDLSAADATSSVGMANPWREVPTKDELEALLGITINIPADAENVIYQIMDSEGLCEVGFDFMGRDCTYRMKRGNQEEDISGMYYEWSEVETTLLHDSNASYQACTSDGDKVELATWFNKEQGITYSLSAIGPEDESFDYWNVAGVLYAATVATE